MIPDDSAQEVHHLNLHINQENTASLVFTKIGHVSAVDPTTNQIKVVITDWTNDNQTYMESGWIPLGTAAAGNQFGIQLLPFGGATVTDPTGQSNAQNGNSPMAEQVLVHVVGRKKGFYIQGVQMFNTIDVPPAGYQDKSGVQPASGEWLYKHATGNYIYFDNTGILTVQAYTNPAPVLKNDQTTDFPATLNLNAVADQGDTNSATVSSNVNASAGAGQYNITINSNDSSMTITIDSSMTPPTYNLSVVNGTVNVQSETSNIKSNTVNLGTGTMRRVLNDLFTQFFNNHTHTGIQSGAGTSGPPSVAAGPDQESQNAFSS